MTDAEMSESPKIVEAMWQTFSDATISADAGDVQRREMRNAFYAGVFSLQSCLENLPENKDEALALVKCISQESRGYFVK